MKVFIVDKSGEVYIAYARKTLVRCKACGRKTDNEKYCSRLCHRIDRYYKRKEEGVNGYHKTIHGFKCCKCQELKEMAEMAVLHRAGEIECVDCYSKSIDEGMDHYENKRTPT